MFFKTSFLNYEHPHNTHETYSANTKKNHFHFAPHAKNQSASDLKQTGIQERHANSLRALAYPNRVRKNIKGRTLKESLFLLEETKMTCRV